MRESCSGRRLAPIRFALLAVLSLCGCGSDAPSPRREPLRLGGSDGARDIVDRLVEGFVATRPGFEVRHLPPTHSGAAVGALRTGEVDVTYLTREPAPEERAGLFIYPFAQDPLVFAAHKGTGVRGLSARDVRELYSGSIRNWASLGGADLPVVLLDRPEYTSPKLVLRSGVFSELEIDRRALLLESPAGMDEALISYPGALGYTSYRSALALRCDVDVLEFNGVYPAPDTVRAGTYPYARTLLFASRDPLPASAKTWFDYLGSVEGQRSVESCAVVPLRREMRLAVPPMRNIVALEVKYGALVRYLQERLGRPVELVHQASYTDLTEAFRKNQIDAAFLGSLAYVVAHLEAGVEVLARPDYGGVSTYRGVIYVRADSPYKTLEDLRGVRLAHAGKGTTAGELFPLYALKTAGLPAPSAFLGAFFDAGSHEAALRAVLEGRADAAAAKDLVLEEMVREDPSLKSYFRELAGSPPVPSNGLAAGPLLGPELKRQIRGLLLSIHESPRGRKALFDLGAKRFVETDDTDYANVYEMVGSVSDSLSEFFQYR